MLIDTHCHLDFPDFAPDQAEIIARAQARGVKRMITISTHLSRFGQVKAVAEKYENVFLLLERILIMHMKKRCQPSTIL